MPDDSTEPPSRDVSKEEALLAGVRAGEPDATQRFIRQHIAWMRALARRITLDEALADDCVQDAFVKALRAIDRFEGRSSVKTWLHRITVNESLIKLRSRKRAAEKPIDDLLPEFDSNACRLEAPWSSLATPEDVLQRQSLRELVRSKIGELPEIYRIVLHLRDIEEMSTSQTAEALDISEENVKVRLHRARAALKKLLEPILRGEMG